MRTLLCLLILLSSTSAMSTSKIKLETKIVYVGATWCGACNYAKPFINQFKKNNPDVNFEVYYFDKLNEQDKKKLFTTYEVGTSIPKYFFIRNGRKIARVGGALNRNQLTCLYQKFIKLNKNHLTCRSMDSRYIFLY